MPLSSLLTHKIYRLLLFRIAIIIGIRIIIIIIVVVVVDICRDGVATSVTIPETRVWQKFEKDWKCIHSHRSAGATNSSAATAAASNASSSSTKLDGET